MSYPIQQSAAAMEDFRHQRRMAVLQDLLARVTKRPVNLLDFSEVSQSLVVEGSSDRGLRDIPIKAIVGSVNRYSDFTRDFLPRHDADIQRWSRVKQQVVNTLAGLPPIEVYQIGDVYFVRDGHHRVSVARELGATQIQAYVTQIRTKIELTPDVTPEELILKGELAGFLQATKIDQVIPNADFHLSVPGGYQILAEHISVHRYLMGIDNKREIPLEEAVAHWYAQVYLPMSQVVRERGILRDFPGRTEVDLYLWVSEHRALLEKELGWEIRSGVAASDLVRTQSPRWSRALQRLGARITRKVIPAALKNVRPQAQGIPENASSNCCLFNDVLIPVSGSPESWSALEQTVLLVSCGEAHLNGLYVKTDEQDMLGARAVREQFEQKTAAASRNGRLSIAEGPVTQTIIDRALVNDLVVLNITHPVSTQIMARLNSGLHTILRSCSRPILAVPGHAVKPERILLAFDGSPKGREALYLSAYLTCREGLDLTVICVEDGHILSRKATWEARRYLENQRISAQYYHERGTPEEVILQVARRTATNLIMMGGYGYQPVLELVLGSTVDGVLRKSNVPVLICQ